MKFSTSLLAAALAAPFVAASSFPPLYYIGALNISITAGQQFTIFNTTRVLNQYLGGMLVDSNGKEIAQIFPNEGGEGGQINSAGIFHPSVRGVLQFTDPADEMAWGFFTTAGIKTTAEYLYVDIETNSTTHAYLNQMFIISNATKTNDSVLHFDLFSPGPTLPPNVTLPVSQTVGRRRA